MSHEISGLKQAEPTCGPGQQNAATVVGVVVAGVLASLVVPGPYDFGSTMIGLVLLAVLVAYGDWPTSRREALGFSAAAGICLLLVGGVLLDRVIDVSGWPTPTDEKARQTLDGVTPWWTGGVKALLVWLLLSAVVYGGCVRHLRRTVSPAAGPRAGLRASGSH
jgi:hypothetical protein